MTDISNEQRAQWAQQALDAFRVAIVHPDGDTQTDIKDLITNLLHLARRECGITDAVHFATLAAQMHDAEMVEDAEADDAEEQSLGYFNRYIAGDR